MSLTDEIIKFWFGDADLSQNMEKRDIWFKSTPGFDADIKKNYFDAYSQAANGELDYLKETPEGSLALIILMDQFPRNLFRGSPQSFATDAKARDVANHMVDQGLDQRFGDQQKIFTYLPFMHSENLADQDKGLALSLATSVEEASKSARDHRDAIARFGRFPHRNQAMGRANTPDEIEYLKNPPTWGKTAAEREEIENNK